jgi:rubrerythrin
MATAKKAVKKKVVKTAKPKKAVKKTAKKASPRKQKDLKAGSRYECSVCGLGVTVDEVCGCIDFCDIICCGEQMKPSK